MKRSKKVILAVLATIALSSTAAAGVLAGCGNGNDNKADIPENTIVNGSFESKISDKNPTWTGWSKTGTGFGVAGVKSTEKIDFSNALDPTVEVAKEGDNWYTGVENPSHTGTLISNVFKLTNAISGKIAFKLGAGKDGTKCYVEFYDADSNTPLSFKLDGASAPVTKAANTDFDGLFITDHMVRHVADLSEHFGKNIKIVVTDNDKSSNYGYVNVDDFVICKTEADATAYVTERNQQLTALRAGNPNDEFATYNTAEQSEKRTIVNGGFEEGLKGWYIVTDDENSGRAFLPSCVKPTAPTGDSSYTYWGDRAVYGNEDYFLCGEGPEKSHGVLRSTTFTLGAENGGTWISLMLGAGKISDNTYVALCDAETNEEIKYTRTVHVEATDTEEARDEEIQTTHIYNEGFNDPDTALMLLRTYVKYPEEVKGKKVYIKIVDSGTADFGFINVDDIRCSLTDDEVKELEKEQYLNAVSQTYQGATYGDLATLKTYYQSYEYPFALPAARIENFAPEWVEVAPNSTVDVATLVTGVVAKYEDEDVSGNISYEIVKDGETTPVTEGLDAYTFGAQGETYTITYKVTAYETEAAGTVKVFVNNSASNSILNGGFETGDLSGWKVLTEGWRFAEGKATGVISADTWWNEKLPYNQSGSYHLDGWNNGIDEPKTWAVRSTEFTLGGSGWITVKMGGHAAAVKVYKANGDLIGEYRQSKFNDAGFPDVTVGHWADMHTYAINLSAFIGEKLYVELHDIDIAGWSHAFFDEVVTYYETAPDYANLYDTVNNADNGVVQPVEVQFPWVLAVNELDAVIFDNTVSNKIVDKKTNTATTLDLTAYLNGITAKYGAAQIPVTDIKITKVERDGATAVTSGFEALDISKEGVYTVTYAGTYNGKTTTHTFVIDVCGLNTIVNGGFETGDLTGWTIQTEGWTTDSAQGVSSDTTYWNEALPHNKTGNYFLSGWNTGIGEPETWSIKSSTFTLGGSGYITVKMGGRAAAVKVYKADGTQIGEYRRTHGIDDGTFPNVGTTDWAGMHTYIIDLSEYIGQDIYIELCDVTVDGGWAQAFFDNVVTYYETAPTLESVKETVNNANGQTPATVEYLGIIAVNTLNSGN